MVTPFLQVSTLLGSTFIVQWLPLVSVVVALFVDVPLVPLADTSVAVPSVGDPDVV